MAKQQPRRPAAASPVQPAARSAAKSASPVSASGFTAPPFFMRIGLQTGLIFAFAFLLYANTLSHNFVLDDAIVITGNVHTQKGIDGIPGILSTDAFTAFFDAEGKKSLVVGGRYRPLTLVLFAVIYEMVGAKPFLFHLVTVLLFALTCAVFYRTLRRMLRVNFGDDYAAMLSWMAAVLFAAHPIHTEVVANIKGCDEIATLLFSLGALWLVFKAWDTGKQHWTALAAISFFLACLSKENAVTFLVVIPLALYFFRPAGAGRVISLSAPLLAAFAVFFVIRMQILDWQFGKPPMELMNNPYLKIQGDQWVPYSPAEKLATIFYTLGKYIWSLLFPHPLTHDYYPKQIPMQTFSSPAALLSMAVYLGLIYWAFRGLRGKDPVRFGVLLYLLTLSIVANFVFPVGTNMGERFVFMPSTGFCLAVSALLLRLGDKGNTTLPLALLGVLTTLYAGKTVVRNLAWASNEKLFFTDVATSDNSAKIHNACGGVLFDKAKDVKDQAGKDKLYRESLQHADKAIQIYPNYRDAYITRAGDRFYLKDYDGAVADYRRALQLAENDPKIKSYLAIALREGGKFYGEKKGDFATSAKMLNESWQINNKDFETARLLGVLNGVQQKPQDALEWFKKAAELAPDNASILFDLGTAYFNVKDPVKGTEYRQKALQLDPKVGEKKQ
ncbi:MAG TPA: glycosyltransferase family 39 protein [Saprospiraceae bacterium]|nr:glycosyltransferase family 39 protein [Saprospiraceae bacterium]